MYGSTAGCAESGTVKLLWIKPLGVVTVGVFLTGDVTTIELLFRLIISGVFITGAVLTVCIFSIVLIGGTIGLIGFGNISGFFSKRTKKNSKSSPILP